MPDMHEKKKQKTSSNGMSRAAKKRAKKKQKLIGSGPQRSNVEERVGIESDNDNDNDNDDEDEVHPMKPPKYEPEVPAAQVTIDAMNDEQKVPPRRLASSSSESKSATRMNLLELLSGDNQSSNPEHQQHETAGITAKDAMTSQDRARAVLQLLLGDQLTVAHFYARYWEKQPVCIQKAADNTGDARRRHVHRLDALLLSEQSIRETINRQPVYYGRDVNVTRYEKDEHGIKRRTTLDLQPPTASSPHRRCNDPDDGLDPTDNNTSQYVRVDPPALWTHYEQGCTVRLLCPHKHNDRVLALLSLLELEWGCMVGANAYLTPPAASQGFAPHYDDIEAFCLQLQGRKRWKVYAPIHKAERLPRVSSEDYTDADLKGVEPVLDVILEPGDLLYMPRGWIHQACTLPLNSDEPDMDGHSLHLTVSSMQQWAWADLMELLLPAALDAAIRSETSTMMRAGLPRCFLDYMGAMHDDRDEHVPQVLRDAAAMVPEEKNDQAAIAAARQTEKLQKEFRTEAKKCIMRVANEAMDMLDATCDQMGKRFLSDRLPPAWTDKERADMKESKQIMPNHLCRLARPGIARLVLEDNMAVLYHCADNSRVYHEQPLSPMEFELDDAPAIEQLLTTIEPHWIAVADLIHDSVEDKVSVTQALYDEGILAVREMS